MESTTHGWAWEGPWNAGTDRGSTPYARGGTRTRAWRFTTTPTPVPKRHIKKHQVPNQDNHKRPEGSLKPNETVLGSEGGRERDTTLGARVMSQGRIARAPTAHEKPWMSAALVGQALPSKEHEPTGHALDTFNEGTMLRLETAKVCGHGGSRSANVKHDEVQWTSWYGCVRSDAWDVRDDPGPWEGTDPSLGLNTCSAGIACSPSKQGESLRNCMKLIRKKETAASMQVDILRPGKPQTIPILLQDRSNVYGIGADRTSKAQRSGLVAPRGGRGASRMAVELPLLPGIPMRC